MTLLVLIKPNFIYDHENNKYKSFGLTKDKSIISLPILSILIAFCLTIFYVQITKKQKVKYIHVPVYMN